MTRRRGPNGVDWDEGKKARAKAALAAKVPLSRVAERFGVSREFLRKQVGLPSIKAPKG